MMTRNKLYINFVLLALATVALAGCSAEAKKERYLKRAQAQFKAGDFDRAEIEYLNALRIEPTNRAAIRDLGIMAFQQGRLPRALAMLSRATALNTNDCEVRLRLGMAALALHGLKQAHREAEFVLDREPTNGTALLLLAESSVASNDLANARQRLDKVNELAGGISEFHLALGNLALRDRNLDGAGASFQKALTLDPKSSSAHFAMGTLYRLRNDPTNAETEYRTAAEAAPLRSVHRVRYAEVKAAAGDTNAALQILQEISKQAPDYLPAILKQAQLAFAARRFQECEDLVKSVLRREPTSLEAMQLMTQLRVAQGDIPTSLIELERSIKEYPRIPQLHYRKAILELANNDVAGAVTSLNQALVLDPVYTEAALLLGQIYIRKGELSPAVTLLTALLRNRPNLPPAQLLLATAYRARGDLDGALKIYQNMAQSTTNNAELLILAGLVQREKGRNDDARETFEKVLASFPDSVGALDQLVGLDIEAKRMDAALRRVQRFVELYPKAPEPLLLLSKIYLAETNLSQAEAVLLKAVELAPNSQPAHQLLARVYVDSNRSEQALKQLQGVVSKNSNDVASWFQIASLQTTASNYVAAKETYEKILTINPKFQPAMNNLAWLCAERLGDLDRAYDLANKARAAYPDDPSMADTLGWVCYRRGDYARALTLIQQSAAKLPDESEVLFHLGMAHYKLGEEAAAKVKLQSALQRGREATWRAEAQECLQVLAFDPATADSQAVAKLEKWLADRPGEPPLLVRMAAVREREGAWDKASAAYESSLKANPNLVSSLVRLAQLDSAKLNKPKEALDMARKARSLSPDDPLIAHTLGVLAYQAGDYKWAFSLLSDGARRLPNDPELQYDYAWAAYSVGQTTNAVTAMRQVMEAGQAAPRYQHAKTFVEMSALLNEPGQAVKSAVQVQELLKQQPDYVPALRASGFLKEQQGDNKGALEAYEKVLQIYPLFLPAYKSLAFLYSHDGQAQKAYDYASKAREALPEDREVARLLGGLSYQRGSHATAIGLLKESAQAFPSDAELFYMLGLSQQKTKMSKESKETLTKALTMDPNSRFAAEAKTVLAGLK